MTTVQVSTRFDEEQLVRLDRLVADGLKPRKPQLKTNGPGPIRLHLPIVELS